MESPVMTSASSHRLRSAVSACAQPTHSYLSSSYLSTSIQCESRNSGGCLKKFNTSGKNDESSPLNVTKKAHSSAEFSALYKRHKACGCGSKNHHRQKGKPHEREVENSSGNGVRSLIPKQFLAENDLLSKLKLNGLDSNRLAEFWDKGQRNESLVSNCDKVINGRGCGRSKKKSTNNGSCSINAYGSSNKVLNHRNSKGKSRKNKNSISDESERGDECSKCGVVHVDEGTRSEICKWQPKHVVTRKSAQIVREIGNAWRLSKSVAAENAKLLNELQGFPPAPKGSEMLEYAKECPGKPTTNSIAFGDFWRTPKDFIVDYKSTPTSPISRIFEENEEKRHRKYSKGMSKYEVFLGGSCNPTTWRTDLAIPELEKMGITYYNPQVEEWRPELMEAEYHAKENATVMFFVIDNQTRGVSALIEVAHLAGNQRKLILVIQSYTQKNQIICDEAISQNEYEDLKTGQDVLQDLVERQGIPVFDNIKVALQCTERILRENLRVQDLQHRVHSSRETSLSPQEVFEKLDSGNSRKISVDDACLALGMLTGFHVSTSHLRTLLIAAGKDLNGTRPEDTKFDFEEFFELLTSFKRQQEGERAPAPNPLASTPPCYDTHLGFPEGKFSDEPSVPGRCKDVYLGGTLENTSWRESVAIPMLQPENLSFFIPKVNARGKRFTNVEAAAMENSFVLLFVITSTARSIAAMAIAGHYIGKGANVVLCVEHLPEDATIGGEKLSENAVKDYNRGRMYLMDIAERSEVPVFDEISMAVKCVIQKCRNR